MNSTISRLLISACLVASSAALPSVAQSAKAAGQDTRWMLDAANQDRVAQQLTEWTLESKARERGHPEFRQLKKEVYARISAGNGISQISRQDDRLIWLEFSNIYIQGKTTPLIDLSQTLDPPYLLSGFQLSPDGKLIMIDVSDNGGEIGTIYICDVETGGFLHTLPDSEMAAASWVDQTHVLISKPSDANDESYAVSQYVYDLETGQTGPAIFGADYTGIELKEGAYPSVWSGNSDSSHVLAYEWRGDNFRVFTSLVSDVIAGSPDWTLISESRDITDAELFGSTLIFLDASDDGQQAVFRRDVSRPDAKPELLVPSSPDFSPQFVLASSSAAYLLGRDGAYHRLLRITPDFNISEIELPKRGSILTESIETLNDGGVIFEMSSPAQRSVWIVAEETARILLQDTAKAQTRNVEMLAETAQSADGTSMPMTLYRVTDTPMKGAPGIVEAYGSYGETQMVVWDILTDIWLEKGGVYSLCHTRGGGYYGRPWHRAGKGPDKSAAHQDLIACAERMTELTGEPNVGALGGSAAGVVVGPAALMRPDVISAVIIMYSWLNPTEFWSDINGPAQIDEMGDPTLASDFDGIARSDSLLLLDQAEAAPATFICLGGHDTRVSSWHSARYIQRFRENFPDQELFVRYNELAGHACSFGGQDLAELIASQFLWMRDNLAAKTN